MDAAKEAYKDAWNNAQAEVNCQILILVTFQLIIIKSSTF